MKKLSLFDIPDEHLASLVACVQNKVRIEDCYFTDLIPILDKVQCEYLSIISQGMDTEETQALVRALMSRVRKVSVGLHRAGFYNGYQEAILVEELTKYDGKGKCEKVDFLEMNYLEFQIRHDIEQWVKDCKWQVLADKENYLLVKRKES